jgi:hypothetical protein
MNPCKALARILAGPKNIRFADMEDLARPSLRPISFMLVRVRKLFPSDGPQGLGGAYWHKPVRQKDGGKKMLLVSSFCLHLFASIFLPLPSLCNSTVHKDCGTLQPAVNGQAMKDYHINIFYSEEDILAS